MVLVCLLLGASALIIGLAVYVSTMTRQYVRHAYEIASHAQISAKHGTDSMALADDTVVMYPGDWEKVSEKEARRFLNWDGKGGPARRCSSPPLFCLPFPRFCDII